MALLPTARTASVALALLLTACAGGVDVAAPTGCPDVRIVQQLDRVVFFSGSGRDLTQVVSSAVISDFTGACTYGDRQVEVELVIDIVGELGRAATGASAQFPYFVAVVGPAGTVLAKQEFTAAIDFANGARRALVKERLEQIIPLDQPASGRDYTIMLGFQLTQQQLPDNRR